MKIKLVSTGTLAIAGLVTTGLMAFPIAATASADDAPVNKRDDDDPDLVLVSADDDDDDTGLNRQRELTDRTAQTRSRATNTGTNTGNTNTGTGTRSGDQNDGTNSRWSKVSRDRDKSRGDLTRDLTTDGPGKQKRDWSANQTNDRSRNDTRR